MSEPAGGSAKPEASFYSCSDDDGVLRCELCFRHCRIEKGKVGHCRVRRNVDGRLIAASYGEVSSVNVDPVEKKPLYHFHPGKAILSVGSIGCNLNCRFCQNWSISQVDAATRYVSPREMVSLACRANEDSGSIGVAFTYSEPLVWYEYVRDCAVLLKQAGLAVVLVTNGTVEPEPLAGLLSLVDAMNIDVKGFSQGFYGEMCRGSLASVKKTVEAVAGRIHLELTTLLVTGNNDSAGEVKELACWVASLDAGIPLHLSRYFPAYEVALPATPVETIIARRDDAAESLKYVYTGNMSGQAEHGSDTICPGCGTVAVERRGYRVDVTGLAMDGSCACCGYDLSMSV